MNAKTPMPPPDDGTEGQPTSPVPPAPVLQSAMVAGGRLRRTLNSSSARTLGLFTLAVAGAWWWLDGGKNSFQPTVRSVADTLAKIAPDELPPRPAVQSQEKPAGLPPPEPHRPEAVKPAAFSQQQAAQSPPSLMSSKGQVRTASPPISTLRPAAYQAAEASDVRGGVIYKAPVVQGWEAIAVGDLERTLKPGTDIPCTLNHAIDGTHPGDFSCIIARDVYGWAWPPTIALIHAGDTVRGSYRPLSPGEGRLLGISAFIDTTVGDKALMVPLGSAPVEDSLGRTGMPGYVESKFWERLGNAVITDIGTQAIRLPSTAFQSTGGGLQVSSNTSERVVEDTLQGQANTVHPLFRKNQGDTINIRITAPVHFGALQYEAVR